MTLEIKERPLIPYIYILFNFSFFSMKRQGLIKFGAFLIFQFLVCGRRFLFKGENAAIPDPSQHQHNGGFGEATALHQETPPLTTQQTTVIKNIKLIVSPPQRMCPPRFLEVTLED